MQHRPSLTPWFSILFVVGACSSKPAAGDADDTSSGGSGGVGGSGVAAGAGGSVSAGSGGTAPSAGGAASTGGSAGVGGTSMSGGTGGSGGTGSTGGSSAGSASAGRAAGGSAGAAAGMGAGGAAAGASGSAGMGGTSGSGGLVLPPGDGCTPAELTETGELHGRYDTLKPMIGGQEYFMQVNEWNSSSPQTMAYGGDFLFKMTEQQASASTTGGPSGFPSVFIGANSRHTTANSNMPKQVSALTTVPTTWVWNDNGTLADGTSIYNATYDVWFSTNAMGEPTASGPSGGYLMVWLHDPPSAEPIGGSPMFQGVTIEGVSGTWDVWIGPNGTRPCISYVRTETALGLSFDLNKFIQDAVTNRTGTIQSSWYLTNIFTGFEIWSGGQGLESTAFCAVVN